jgi:hypothetical protein
MTHVATAPASACAFVHAGGEVGSVQGALAALAVGASGSALPTTVGAATRTSATSARDNLNITRSSAGEWSFLTISGMTAGGRGLQTAVNTPAESRDVASVERFIPAPPTAIFDLLADPARHKEIDGSGTVQGPPAGSQRLALGSTFGMDMKAGLGYTMVNTVVEFEDDRRIAWQPRPDKSFLRSFIGGRIWRYELEPRDGGTLVRESWDISQEKLPFMVRPLRSRTIDAMTKTLERIEQVVTAA